MSTALLPLMSSWSILRRALLAFGLSDETFAYHSLYLPQTQQNQAFAFGINILGHLAWIVSGLLGFAASQFIPDVKIFGFDFALPAVFIALIVLMNKNKFTILVSLLSAILAVILVQLGLAKAAIIGATLLSASIGLGCKIWFNKTSA